MYKAFLDRAKKEAELVRHEEEQLKTEQEKLERRLDEIKEKRLRLSNPDDRLMTYNPKSEDCPVCHVRGDSTNSNPRKLHTVPSAGESDYFKCSHCGTTIEVV